jgi:hypothetical protein
MGEKMRNRLAKGAATFLEPGETVRSAVTGLAGPKWVLAFGALGALFSKPRTVILTERNIYILTVKGMQKAKGVESKQPIGSVGVSLGTGVANVPLTIGTEKIWISKVWRKDAEELVANANGGKPA